MTTNEKAKLLRALHTANRPLALANAWDVASARVIEAAGAPVVATTSAGVAWSLGAPDGDALDRDRAVDLIARIAAAVSVPVTADIESGFGLDTAGVCETVARVVQAGAVGVNIEDTLRGEPSTLRAVAEQTERLAAARGTADELGVDLFINARIDTYLRGIGGIDETLARAEVYLAAGASGIFVPGVTDAATISELVAGIPAPLNILTGPDSPDVAALGGLGVARVSLGSWVSEAAYAVAHRAARELYGTGTYTSLAGSLAYGELNALFGR